MQSANIINGNNLIIFSQENAPRTEPLPGDASASHAISGSSSVTMPETKSTVIASQGDSTSDTTSGSLVTTSTPEIASAGNPTTEEEATMVTQRSNSSQTEEYDEETEQVYVEAYVAMLFERYGGGVVLVAGTLGNVMALVVLNTRRMRALPASFFLSVLAGVDLAFLVLGQGGRHFARTLTGVDLPALSRAYCKAWYHLVPALSMYSDWVLTGVSIERCIAVSLPLYAKSLVTSFRSRLYLLLAFCVCAGYYSYVFVYYDVTQVSGPGNVTSSICTLLKKDPLFTVDIRPWLEFTINSILPATIILLSNAVTTWNLVAARRRRKSMHFRSDRNHTSKSTGSGNGCLNGTGTGTGSRNVDTNALIGMLLAISLAFVLLTTPVRVGFVLDKVFPAQYWASDRRRAVYRLFWAVGLFCLYLSHAANFPLYILTGGAFRRGLREVCCCCCVRRRVPPPQMTVTSSGTASVTSSVDRLASVESLSGCTDQSSRPLQSNHV